MHAWRAERARARETEHGTNPGKSLGSARSRTIVSRRAFDDGARRHPAGRCAAPGYLLRIGARMRPPGSYWGIPAHTPSGECRARQSAGRRAPDVFRGTGDDRKPSGATRCAGAPCGLWRMI